MPRVTIYSKPDCHLCDVAKERVNRIRLGVTFDLETVDISSDASLDEHYGEKIPVVFIDDDEIFAYRVNDKVLRRKLIERGAKPTSALRALAHRLSGATAGRTRSGGKESDE